MKTLIKVAAIFSICLVGVTVSGCKKTEAVSTRPKQEVTRAKVILTPTQGNRTKGTVTFTQEEGAVRIVVNVEGLTPGEHGLHIHEFGDCSAPDGSSAGGHFNPTHSKHGAPTDQERHVGDLGNITADSKGKVYEEKIDKVIKLNGDSSIIGRSVIIHSAPDDFVTQPTGNAGGRVSCGVIMVY